jgi:hypothetical protein
MSEVPMEICKATIAFDDSKITFEGSAEFVEDQVQKFAGMQRTEALQRDTPRDDHPPQNSTEKQFVMEKRPRGHHEIATVLAFALCESGIREFTEADIRRAYIRADVRPPKYVSQALRDAKSKFDYIETGSKRGMYRLSPHGDRTVRFDLPRRTG